MTKRPKRRRRLILIAAAMFGLLALLYAGDLLLSQGSMPRHLTVAGVQVGGLDPAEAERKIRAAVQPRTTQPITVQAGDVKATIDPRTTGLKVDWAATMSRATEQPLNPWTRVRSLFTDREAGVASTDDPALLAGAVDQLVTVVNKPVIEGNVKFEGTTPKPVQPQPGSHLDLGAAANILRDNWVLGVPVMLPMVEDKPTTTPEAVAAALEQVAKPAVSAPITIVGEKDAQASVKPLVIAAALQFEPDGNGGLRPKLEPEPISEAAKSELAPTEQPGRDATVSLQGGRPVVTPSVDGRGVDYPKTLESMVGVLTKSSDRRVNATYGPQPAKLTTEDINKLGITAVIGEFTTGGFAPESGQNIKRAAAAINGDIVKPGETYSLNAATGPRGAANGYVEAGIIYNGAPDRGVGGGVSQLATTLYNASYFAGMTDVAHTEHSYYITRYPAGREATVFEGSIDLKFRNDGTTGVLIQTVWTPGSITVRLYGTKRYIVTSQAGERTNPTTPGTVTIPPGKPCKPSEGADGFTITDTRTLKEISTGKTSTQVQTVVYQPQPKVECGAG